MRRGQTPAKLGLRKQTLRALTTRELSRVAGGTDAYFYFDPGSGGSGSDDTSMSQGPGGWSACCNCM